MAKRTPAPHLQSHSDQPLRHAVIAPLLAVVCVLVLLVVRGILKRLPAGGLKAPTLAMTGSMPRAGADRDERLRKRILGTWTNFYHGDRTLTIRSDGTATMVVVFHGMKARLFTPRLQLEMNWSISDGYMMRRTVGGKPADKVAFVNRYAGQRATQRIVKLTASRLELLDQDNDKRHLWRRADK